jgi:putative hydrolase of the HAD superfamily
MERLDAIFFDIDDTLYSTSEFAKLARLNSIHAMIQQGLRMTSVDAFRELSEVIREFGSNYGDHYQKLLLRVPPETYAGLNPAILIAAGVGAYHKTKFESLRPYEDVMEVFACLKEKTDLRLGIISAGLTVKQADKLVRLGVLPYLDPKAIFITDQLGIGKQNPKLYKKVCQQLELSPGRCMYVGDNPPNDVDPANAAGMITVLNRRGGKHMDVEGKTKPAHVISDLWDLLEVLRTQYGIET